MRKRMAQATEIRKTESKRMANMEGLRILAMMMVIMLHYLGKGEVLPALTGSMDVNGYVSWILETLSIVAVNVYMLISGYFLSGSGFKAGRLLQLLCQILFYSILVPVVLLCLGILKPGDLTIYQLLQYCLPTQMIHYWFATAYVVMYLFSPILNIAVKNMKKGQLQAVILLLLVFQSLNKSLLPVRLEMDNLGYDGIWFMCVYLIAAYIRLYGIPLYTNGKRSFCLYLAGCVGILGVTFAVRALYFATGQFENFIGAAYHYNHILNLFAAISLFYAFYDWKLSQGRFAWVILRIAPYTFGVYLLHEHLELRYRWPQWLGVHGDGNVLLFILRSIATVVLVFAVGIGVDLVRGLLFRAVGRFFAGGRLAAWLQKLDGRLAGK